MRKQFIGSICMIMFFSLITSCATSGELNSELSGDGNSNVVVLTEEQNGGLVALKVGDVISIELDGIAGTGYSWEVDTFDESLLQQEGEVAIVGDSKLSGGLSHYVIKFKAINIGTGTLKLNYERTFEPDIPPDRTFMSLFDIQ